MAGRVLDEVFTAGAEGIRLAGDWTLRGLDECLPTLRRALATVPPDARWSLRAVRRMDSFGALPGSCDSTPPRPRNSNRTPTTCSRR